MKTTNYYNTFIEVADDCPAQIGKVPEQKGKDKTVAQIEYELISTNPYQFTSDDVLFAVFSEKNNISQNDELIEREKFFSKSQACLRASPLGKRYGWGIHFNEEGKLALYAVNSNEYKKLQTDNSIDHVKAMRSKRA